MPALRLAAFAMMVLLVGLPRTDGFADKPPADQKNARVRLLNEAKLATDDASLLALIRSRTISAADRARVQALIRQLGDDSFDVREEASEALTKIGALSVPFLRRAQGGSDVEVVRRAELCLLAIPATVRGEHLLAAAELLAERNLPETVPVLFAFLSSTIHDDSAADALLEALAVATRKAAKADAVLRDALGDKDAQRRAWAGQVVANALPEQRPAVRKLLDDPEPLVRYRIAATLAPLGERQAILALTAMLDEAPYEYAVRAEDWLYRLLGDVPNEPPPAAPAPDPAQRRRCRQAWEEWWRLKGPKLDLVKACHNDGLRGDTLVYEADLKTDSSGRKGRIWEYDRAGKTLWEFPIDGCVSDVHRLPGGRLLVTEIIASRITERDHEGKVLWETGRLAEYPIAAERLPNGNTLVATSNGLYDLTPEKKRIDRYPALQEILHAFRVKNGHFYALTFTHIVEMGPDGKEMRRIKLSKPFTLGQGWGGLEVLPGGRFRIALTGLNKVLEVDAQGKIVWEVDVPNPRRTQQLPNGNMLIAGFESAVIMEFSRDKKEVSRVPAKGHVYGIIRH